MDGRLIVRLSVKDKTARLAIEDDGPGYSPGDTNGMGSRLIEGFVTQLGGTLEIDVSAGTKTVVSFPVD